MNPSQAMAELTVAEGRVTEYLELAAKAMAAGKWEKGLAYGTLARAWQTERDRAEKQLVDYRP